MQEGDSLDWFVDTDARIVVVHRWLTRALRRQLMPTDHFFVLIDRNDVQKLSRANDTPTVLGLCGPSFSYDSHSSILHLYDAKSLGYGSFREEKRRRRRGFMIYAFAGFSCVVLVLPRKHLFLIGNGRQD